MPNSLFIFPYIPKTLTELCDACESLSPPGQCIDRANRAELNQAFTDLEGVSISIPPLHRADFGGTARHAAVAAEVNGKIYVGTGFDGAYKKDWWEYDPVADTWTQKTDFGGVARHAAVAAEAGGTTYVGTGYDGANKKDWWWQS